MIKIKNSKSSLDIKNTKQPLRSTINYYIINSKGLYCYYGEKIKEHVIWKELTHVYIYTTEDGPFAEDFFWILGGKNQQNKEYGVVVGNAHAVKIGLNDAISQLPNVNFWAIIEASASIVEARFNVWKKK